MQVDLKEIAPLVAQQFPAFYQEEGENFIQFVKAYYEWMDQEGATYKSRRLLEYTDINEVTDEYIDYFLKKYMRGIPKNILADKRLLEKHIIDVYRSKGSIEGLKLLFRLLYNLEINVYLPQKDMLRTSDGKWIRNKYLEVEERSSNSSYNKKLIRGTTSGATAYVSSATKVNTGQQLAHVFYLSDITTGSTGSSFVVGEYLVYDGLDIKDATLIKGSAVGASIIFSSEDHAPGDILLTSNTTGEGLKFNVSSILQNDTAKGYINFKLVDGGYGYAIDSPVTVSYKTASSGNGAIFKVKSLANTITFPYNINPLTFANGLSFANTLISANDYGVTMYLANSQSIIGTALTSANITIGSIASLGGASSGDHNYNGSVQTNVFEKRVHGYGIIDSKGKIWGNNAIITGELATGNGVIKSVELVSSGLGYNTQGEVLVFYNENDDLKTAELTLEIGAIGYEEGFWADESSFLNADKYITDSDYYQEYSYEIQFEKSLDKYINVLKQVMHPVGNRVFSRPILIDSKQSDEIIQTETLVVNT
jgi:hypothetical protein